MNVSPCRVPKSDGKCVCACETEEERNSLCVCVCVSVLKDNDSRKKQMPFRLPWVTRTFAIWYEPEHGFPLLPFPLRYLFPFHFFPFLVIYFLYFHSLSFYLLLSLFCFHFLSSPLLLSLLYFASLPLLHCFPFLSTHFLSIYFIFLSFLSSAFFLPFLSSPLSISFPFLPSCFPFHGLYFLLFPFFTFILSFLSFTLLFSFPFLFRFISPHPPAQLTHLADLTNEDTTHPSLILLSTRPPSLYLPPPAPLSLSADKMVKTCVAAAALPTAAAFNSSSRREQHSFRPELCEHQLFLKWAE